MRVLRVEGPAMWLAVTLATLAACSSTPSTTPPAADGAACEGGSCMSADGGTAMDQASPSGDRGPQCGDGCKVGHLRCNKRAIEKCVERNGCGAWSPESPCTDPKPFCAYRSTGAGKFDPQCTERYYELTPIGKPVWVVADVLQFPAALSTFSQLIRKVEPAADVNSTPHPGPYDHEVRDQAKKAGYEDTNQLTALEASGGNSMTLHVTLVPGPDAPTGTSSDSASGAIIPKSVLPMNLYYATRRGGEYFEQPETYVVWNPDHKLVKGYDGISHSLEHFATAVFPKNQAGGPYLWEIDYVDAQGNGWRIRARFDVACSGAQCPSQCTEGRTRCMDRRAQACWAGPAGAVWTDTEACNPGYGCYAVGTSTELACQCAKDCTVGQRRCSSRTIQECKDDGKSCGYWADVKNCGATKEICDATNSQDVKCGACVDPPVFTDRSKCPTATPGPNSACNVLGLRCNWNISVCTCKCTGWSCAY